MWSRFMNCWTTSLNCKSIVKSTMFETVSFTSSFTVAWEISSITTKDGILKQAEYLSLFTLLNKNKIMIFADRIPS